MCTGPQEELPTTPRTMKRRLQKLLRRLGLDTRLVSPQTHHLDHSVSFDCPDQLSWGVTVEQAPEELRSLRRELFGGKRGNLDKPVGTLRISVIQGRDLKDVRRKSAAHSFERWQRSIDDTQ